MNYLTTIFENMPDVVDTQKCTIYNTKNFKFISFILYSALEGKPTFGDNLLIPEEIIFTVISFTFKQRIFFHRPVFIKMHEKKIQSNEKVIIRKTFNNGNNCSIKLQNNLFPQQKASGLLEDNLKIFSDQNISMLYSINIINTWKIKGN